MYKAYLSFFVLLFLSLFSTISFAQSADEFELEKERAEEEAKKNEIKSRVGLWRLDGYGAFQDSSKLDTLHDIVHIFHPVYKKAITATYTGNYGTPALDNNFFNRKYTTDFFFAHSREAYMLTRDNIEFYNTTTPYTRLDYTQSENKSKNNETRFNVVHSQNITPFWNFTFRTNQEKSDGQYNAQESKDNFVAFYTSYNRDEWNVYGGFISNSVENNENGGLTEEEDWLSGAKDPEFWSTNLNSSQTKLGNTSYFANAEYRIGKFEEAEKDVGLFTPQVGVLYSFRYDRYKQKFKEDESDGNTYFDTAYYNDDYLVDDIRFNRLTNVFQLKQYENADKKISFGKRAYIGHELDRGSMPGIQLNDTVHVRTDIKESGFFLGGGIFRETGKFWRWNFDGKIYFTGRKSGQTEINGTISKPFRFWGDSLASLSFTGAIENLVPDYFQENFYSDHIRWQKNLDMEQRVTVGASFKVPARKFEIGAQYAIVNNYIYNDTLGVPSQTGNEILVMAAYLDKDFNYRNLHFRTHVLWQKASDEEYIHLPDLSALVSAYYQFTISKVLFSQIGTDLRYNTKYYADAYAPSTGLFYLQDEAEYGDYPFIDVYASLRLKRTRVFFKWMNIGTHFLDGNYMTTPNYPMNRSTFRLGVSWAFYD